VSVPVPVSVRALCGRKRSWHGGGATILHQSIAASVRGILVTCLPSGMPGVFMRIPRMPETDAAIDLCGIITPLGLPVEPEVYMTTAGMAGSGGVAAIDALSLPRLMTASTESTFGPGPFEISASSGMSASVT
jgi:hypothetical protein